MSPEPETLLVRFLQSKSSKTRSPEPDTENSPNRNFTLCGNFTSLEPEILISRLSVPFILGGTTLLIVVQVTMDFVGQLQSHLIAYQYEGLIKKAALVNKGKRR